MSKEILLSNPLFFGATMVRVGDADGMVAGAINSSANVLRAALQVVKTALVQRSYQLHVNGYTG